MQQGKEAEHLGWVLFGGNHCTEKLIKLGGGGLPFGLKF